MKRLTTNILVAIISLLATYLALEVAYRLYRYNKLTSDYQSYRFVAVEAPLYLFDEEIGYRYEPNSQLQWRRFDADDNPLLSNNLRVNNLGHISPTDDVVPKPPGEFRIAVLGDSFTACVTNDIPWPAILEEKLNNGSDLKRALGVSAFKVINFGMDGTGIVQWSSVYDYEVQRFEPDLVIVNFVTDDIRRKFIWRTTLEPDPETAGYQIELTCSSLPTTIQNEDCSIAHPIVIQPHALNDKNELARIKREIYEKSLGQIRWVSLHPELLARTMGNQLGLLTRLTLHHANHFYANEDEAVRNSLEALRAITVKHPRVLILHIPDHSELVSRTVPPLLLQLMREGNDLEIVQMAKFLPDQYLDQDIEPLFIGPFDGHFGNYGAEMYSSWVYSVVKECLLLGGEAEVAQ